MKVGAGICCLKCSVSLPVNGDKTRVTSEGYCKGQKIRAGKL